MNTSNASEHARTTGNRQRRAAFATVTVVGGTLVVNGTPATAASFAVTNTDASGPGSFAQAVIDANATPEADTVTFASGVTGTITLDDTARISADLSIVGPGDGSIVLTKESGDVLYLYDGASLTVSGMSFADVDDDAIDGNGAGALTISDTTFESARRAVEMRGGSSVSITDVEMTDVRNGLYFTQTSGAVTISALESGSLDDNSYAYGTAVNIRRTYGDVSLTDATVEGSVRIRQTTPDGASMLGDVTVRNVDVGADGFYAGLRLYDNEGMTTVDDVTVSADRLVSLRVAGDRESHGLGEDTNVGTAQISDVTLSSANGSARFSIGDFEDFDATDVAGATSLNVRRTDAGSIADTTIIGADQTANFDFKASDDELVAERDDFRFDGVVMSFDEATVEMQQVTAAEHIAGVVINLDQSDVTFRHSTIGNNTVSGPVVSVSGGDGDGELRPAKEIAPSTLRLDHTILGDAPGEGFDFAAVVDNGGPGLKKAVDPADFDVVAEYSVVPAGVATDYDLAASNVETDDARLGPVSDAIGDRPTASPLPGSPAIDGGDSAIDDAPEFDARGRERIVDIIDIGAVESSALLTSIEPARFVDTRSGPKTIDGRFEGGGKRQSGSVYTIDIAGRGEVPEGATAVVMNVTAVAPEGGGFVTLFACDDEQPNASSLNFSDSNVGNEVIAGLADDGSICAFVQGVAHLTVDVVAYATELSSVKPVTPARSFESRIGQSTADGRFQGTGVLAAGSETTIRIAGRNGVPADAEAVIVNVTAIRPDSNGFITVHGCLPDRPNASSLNYDAGAVRANEIIAQLNESGELCVYTSAATNLALDVVGYLPAGAIETVAPARLLDSRTTGSTVDDANEGDGQLAAGESVTLPVAGRASVPDGVKAVVVNVTAIRPQSRGFITVDGCADPRPTASSLNYEAGVNGANEIIAGVNSDGEICLYSSAPTDLAVDVVAFIR